MLRGVLRHDAQLQNVPLRQSSSQELYSASDATKTSRVPKVVYLMQEHRGHLEATVHKKATYSKYEVYASPCHGRESV